MCSIGCDRTTRSSSDPRPPARESLAVTAAAILAGGRATRLEGRDKSALTLGAERFLDRQIARLRQVVDDVLVVTNAPERYAALPVHVVRDAIPDGGALGGIYSALLARPATHVLVVACDMPFLTVPFLGYLVDAGRDVDLAIPRTAAGYEPLCASYGPACRAPIQERLAQGQLTLVDLVTAGLRVRELGPEELARFDPDAALFFNVNTSDDYRRAVRKFSHQNR